MRKSIRRLSINYATYINLKGQIFFVPKMLPLSSHLIVQVLSTNKKQVNK